MEVDIMNYNPVFDFAFVCGRYGHAHLGHYLLIQKGIELSKKMYVAVGSAQEKSTLRNPFPVETRIRVLKQMFAGIPEDKLIIDGINDMSNEFNRSTSWGTYLKNHLIKKFGKFPDLILYGHEGGRSNWFEESDMINTHELLVPRGMVPISGTEIRGYLIIDDKDSWHKYVPESIYHMYDELRDELMQTPVYHKIYNTICADNDFTMDAFMRVYDDYAKADREKKIAQLQQMQK